MGFYSNDIEVILAVATAVFLVMAAGLGATWLIWRGTKKWKRRMRRLRRVEELTSGDNSTVG